MKSVRSSRRSTRRYAFVGVALALAAAAVVLLLVTSDDEGKTDTTARGEVLAYQEKLLPLVQHWGRIEVQGMRPAIADLRDTSSGVPDESIATEADAWKAALEGIREDMRAVSPPPRLRRAGELFDQSMLRYLDAAALFKQAVAATGDAREALIQQGIGAAVDGARIYNEASLLIQGARKAVGLPPTEDFPNQPAGEEMVS